MRYLLLLFFAFGISPAWCQHRETQPAATHIVIEEINISGNKKTRDAIILRELNIVKGQVVRSDSIPIYRKSDSLRLATVGLFTHIHISVDTLISRNIIWNIHVKERWFIIPEPTFQLADRNFNVWWNEQNRDIRRAIIGVTVRHKNFRGNLENLIATVQVGYTRKFGLEYLKPYIDKQQKHGFGIAFAIAESQETFFTTDSNKFRFIKTKDQYILRHYEGSVAYTYRPAYASRHTLRLGYKHLNIEDTVAKLNSEYYKNGSSNLKMIELSYRFEQNKTDNWNYPLRGTKIIGQLISRFGIEGMNHQSFATLEVGKFFNPAGKWYISTIFRGRLSFPDEQPYALRTALGGKFDYVRGYEYYVIDGSHFGVLRINFKRELLNITIGKVGFKYLPVIPIRIYPKLFADAGYVHNQFSGNSFLNNKPLYAAGVGIDIFTFYDIKIRLEYTINHLRQKDLFLHFHSE
ncbi:MAG TPA: BamA/TamA family outer membrane protein [Flavipsychrobacter sp.]|nr:BamA/TamA family outer membrane protein [Flavipsychrobacter sp.]